MKRGCPGWDSLFFTGEHRSVYCQGFMNGVAEMGCMAVGRVVVVMEGVGTN